MKSKSDSWEPPLVDEGNREGYFDSINLLIFENFILPNSSVTVKRAKYTPLETLLPFQVAV